MQALLRNHILRVGSFLAAPCRYILRATFYNIY